MPALLASSYLLVYYNYLDYLRVKIVSLATYSTNSYKLYYNI
jgi:hypothetical protein